jgi:hypothetical protein
MIVLRGWSLGVHPYYFDLPEGEQPLSLRGIAESGPHEGRSVVTSVIRELVEVIDGFPVVKTKSGTLYRLAPEPDDSKESGESACTHINEALKINEGLK